MTDPSKDFRVPSSDGEQDAVAEQQQEQAERDRAAEVQRRLDDNASELAALLVFALTIPIGWALWWGWTEWMDRQVESSQPIGTVLRVGSAGSFSGSVVLETESGFYPLGKAITVAKGTALVLELRRSGRRFVCDVPRRLCVQTSVEGFVLNQAGGQR